MSYSPFKEVTTANPGSETRYGSDDLLDIMKIFNAKIATSRRPDILNPWRFSGPVELKQVSNPPAPTEANVIILYNDIADNKLKVKKSGGGVVNIEDLGSGAWNNSAAETITNKTIPVESNFIKHGTTNFVGDLLKYDGTRYNRIAKGAANQVLAVNAAATDLEWQTPAGGGGGGGEANTASNIGTAGIGLFAQKLGINLEFKKVFSPTGTVLITDNIANERVDLDLAAGIVTVNQVNTYGDFNQTYRSSRLRVSNPANTFAYSIVGSAITVSRNLVLPLLTADDTVAVVASTQTLANKTLATSSIDVDTNTIKHSTTNTVGDLLRNTGTKFDRLAKGGANTYLKVNAGGTDLEWGAAATGTLDALTDVAITSPAVKQTLRYNGTSWLNTLLSIDDLADAIITSPVNDHFLRHNGTNWINSGIALNSLSDVVITLPTNGQHLVYNGTTWVNTTSSGGAREELAATFGPAGVDDLGGSYTDAINNYVSFAGSSLDTGTKAVSPCDFTGKTQYKVSISLVTGSGDTIDVRIVDDSNTGNVLHEFTGEESGTLTSGLTTLPGWATGVKTLRLQLGSGGGGDDVGVSNAKVFLK